MQLPDKHETIRGSSFNLLLAVIFAAATTFANCAVQCNVGLKLFSSESGNAICAPLSSHFNCVESCEWNTSCSLTSHYAAFHGRRTYVSGMVLTSKTFILQCCASLGIIVEMNARKEAKCVWTPVMETVEENGSLRFDPPLATNEYIREMIAERVGNGRVKMKVQICKFVAQRTNCSKDTMTPEDATFHTLLLMRLSRTKETLNRNTKHNNVTDQFKDDKPITSQQLRSLVIHASPNSFSKPINTAIKVTGDAGEINFDNNTELIFNTPNLANSGVLPFLSDSVSISHQSISKNEMHRDQPLPKNEKVFGSNNKNNDASISPRYHTIRMPTSSQKVTPESDSDKNSNTSPLMLNDDPISLTMASPSYNVNHARSFIRKIHASEVWPREGSVSNIWYQRSLPLDLKNVTQRQELVPTSYWRRLLSRRHQIDNQINNAKTLRDNRTITYPILTNHNRRVNQLRLEKDVILEEELPLKNKLQEQKLTTKHHHTFHPQAPEQVFPMVATKTTIPPTREEELKRYYTNSLAQSLMANDGTTGALTRAPPFKVIPLALTQTQSSPTISIIRRPFTSLSQRQRQLRIQKLRQEKKQLLQNPRTIPEFQTRQINDRPEPTNTNTAFTHSGTINKNDKRVVDELFHINQNKASTLNRLLSCCQQQAPGCKHLCSADVSKEEIKHALVTQQCPPLSMTSVIQCFPRYYNITPVTQCCNANSQRHANTFTLGSAANQAKLPDQCLGLCSPDFRLSFAHFACIDHIATIVECYRGLLQ